jgi:hypothetical protein
LAEDVLLVQDDTSVSPALFRADLPSHDGILLRFIYNMSRFAWFIA